LKKQIKTLADAVQGKLAKPKLKPRGKPTPDVLAPYHFKPGQSGNPSGRPRDHAREAMDRLAHTSPPKALCEQIGIEPGCTWVEAIVYSLGKAAVNGDVAAAREVLANLGLRGALGGANVQVNIETDPAKMGQYQRFIAETRWMAAEDFEQIWALCRQLNRPPTAHQLTEWTEEPHPIEGEDV